VLNFSQQLVCPKCSTSYEELAPRNFSFNTPYGACEKCLGLGTTYEVDQELVVPDPTLSITQGAIAPWRSAHTMYFTRMLESVAEEQGIDTDRPWSKLTAKQQKVIMHGLGDNVVVKYRNRYGRVREYSTTFEGVIPWLKRRHETAESDHQREQFESQRQDDC
jgi:excinuclease ABC subunit A